MIRTDLYGSYDLEVLAIDRLRMYEPPEGYYLCNSFGKDSSVIEHLCIKSGVKFESHHSLTGLDAPETIRFGVQNFPNTIRHRPLKTIEQLIVDKGVPPTRRVAYCCEYLKENAPSSDGRRVVLGVRWSESFRRSKRLSVERCYRNQSKTYINPIIEWTDSELWQYINQENILVCPLYFEGHKRLGCVACPKAGPDRMREEFKRWPHVYDKFMRIFEKSFPTTHLLSKKTGKPKKIIFNSAQETMDWWLNPSSHVVDPSQLDLFGGAA